MPANTKKVLEIDHPELVIDRVFDAPRALVFKAWIEAPRMAAWWGPKAFSNPVCEIDARPGGAIRVHMQGPDGTVYPMGGEYKEIDEPRRLVLTTFAEDEEGLLLENLVTVTFEEEGSKTRMRLSQRFTHIKARAAGMVKGSTAGWTQSIDKLGDYVSKQVLPFSISRVFQAPRALVFKVHTDPVHLAKWFGPAGTQVIKADMDLRPGGTYHYGLRTQDGAEMWGKQVFREIVAPERLVFVQSFSDKDGGMTRHPMAPAWPLEMLSVVTFEELGPGKCKLTVQWEPLNAPAEEGKAFDGARDGMNSGFKGTFDALEAYLKTL
ncbi:MAG TPA: SRPBCC domain-containing protein [bacterium]|jgi:uncharacterized protein YndB with AHSA1/START domain|nr:SRPBCC domain-containing protein [bacterium]